MLTINFPDKYVSYDKFIEDLSTALVPKIMESLRYPNDIISQNKAFTLFGKASVKRWLKKGQLEPVSKRPGKIEYNIHDLKILQRNQQDYL